MIKSRHITIFDTTLRDGSQGEDISYSVEDKLAIAQKLDELGVDYIEGGWPAPGNVKDLSFFKLARKRRFKNAELVAFASTRRAGTKTAQDPILRSLLEAETKVVCIFGKSWDLHVKKVLRVSHEENLHMIEDSVKFLRSRRRQVIYDAEHFFDGFKNNPSYALQTLRAAQDGGAHTLVLCDTNGGSTPSEVASIVAEVRKSFGEDILGIHAHNDGDLAVANSLAAVQAGARHVQGTINGYGERCGNANLCSVIPDLRFKLNFESIPEEKYVRLTELSRFVSSVANMPLSDHQPFVGVSAFAHKAGIHVDAMLKESSSYEHLAPSLVGNVRRFLASEQAGKAAVIAKAAQYGLRLAGGGEQAKQIIRLVKERELEGYQYEGADASLELLMRKLLGSFKPSFELISYQVNIERRLKLEPANASVTIRVGGQVQSTVASGNGPVNALDAALRKGLARHYPTIGKLKLIDYKVRVLGGAAGTGSRVRVVIETSDSGAQTWSTVGVHENIIEASWEALVDSVEYRLLKKRR